MDCPIMAVPAVRAVRIRGVAERRGWTMRSRLRAVIENSLAGRPGLRDNVSRAREIAWRPRYIEVLGMRECSLDLR
jgi:hypothetical protein